MECFQQVFLRPKTDDEDSEKRLTYDGVEITTNSDEIYEESEKGESYQAIVKIATHKKNGKELYFLENVADKPVSKAVKE